MCAKDFEAWVCYIRGGPYVLGRQITESLIEVKDGRFGVQQLH